jgi:hypothetical protein
MSDKHTPGEWRAAKRHIHNTGNVSIYSGDNLVAVAACKEWGYDSACSREEAMANARLIAAAPQLKAENAKLRGFIERWLSAQPGQDYKGYIHDRVLAEEARHLIGNAAGDQDNPLIRDKTLQTIETARVVLAETDPSYTPTSQSVEDQIRQLKAREKFTEDFGYHRDVPTADGYEVQQVWEQRVVGLSWHELTHDQRLIQILDNTDIQRLPFEDRLSILQAQVEITKISSEHHHHFTERVERDPRFNAPASDYARTLDATARRAQQRDPGRGIDR